MAYQDYGYGMNPSIGYQSNPNSNISSFSMPGMGGMGSGFSSIGGYGVTSPTPLTFGDMMTQSSSNGSIPTPGVDTYSGVPGNVQTPNVGTDLAPVDNIPLFRNGDGTFNWGAVGTLTKALGGLGSLYLGFQQNKMAKDALRFQKRAYETNLANQIKSYNTSIADRAKSRAEFRGNTADANATREEYVRNNSL